MSDQSHNAKDLCPDCKAEYRIAEYLMHTQLECKCPTAKKVKFK